jgi:hypothetical protein
MEDSMKYGFAAAALAISVLPAFALQLAPISPHQALANRGQCVTIEGVAGVRSDPQRPGLDVDLDGKDSSAFGYVLPQNQGQFPNLNSMDGQRVAITGVVTMYLGRAQIHMTSARQLSPAGAGTDSGLTHVGPEWAKGDLNSVCGA